MDDVDRQILSQLCLGGGVFVNMHRLSKNLNCHRNTVRSRVRMLLDKRIIHRPRCFYNPLLENRSLISIDFVDCPVSEVSDVVRKPNVVGVYRIHKGEHNTLILGFWENVLSHKVWEGNYFYKNNSVGGTESVYIPSEFIIKMNFNGILPRLIEKKARVFGSVVLDDLAFKILCYLVRGDFLWINEHAISKKVGVHRKTVKRRISSYFENNIIKKPRCYFHSYFTPPHRLMVVSLFESRNPRFLRTYFKRDPHIIMLAKINHFNYTHLVLSSHNSITTYSKWSDSFQTAFKDIVGGPDVSFVPSENVLKADFDPVIKNLLYSE